MGEKRTGEQHNCASFGALDPGHHIKRIEDVVGQGNRYGFLLLTVARGRHLRNNAVDLKGCSLPSLSLPSPIFHLVYMS